MNDVKTVSAVDAGFDAEDQSWLGSHVDCISLDMNFGEIIAMLIDSC